MDYMKEADVALTVCDKEGKIIYMNDKSRRTFLKPGREELIGKNVLDCHPEPARSQLADMYLTVLPQAELLGVTPTT